MTGRSDGRAARDVVAAVWRIESARIVATLARSTGDFALAEDLAQEALAEALVTWPRDGVPDAPAAWLLTVGRRRAIEGVRVPESVLAGIEPLSRRPLNLPERTAVNTVIQGSAADLIKLAMIAIARRLRQQKSPAKMILQIHDELVFEAPADEINSLAKMVQQEMQFVIALRVPLKVDVKSGDNWAECEPWNG